MKALPELIKDKFFEFLAGKINLKPFEQWVYVTEELENFLSFDDYIQLISLNFDQKSSKYEAYKILIQYTNPGEFETWKLKKMLSGVVNRDSNIAEILSEFYYLYCHGYDFLNWLGLGYGLMIKCPPPDYSRTWEDLSIKEQKNLIDSFYPEIIDEAKKILTYLDEHTIVTTEN